MLKEINVLRGRKHMILKVSLPGGGITLSVASWQPTSREVKGTSIPTEPESVVYTISSEPPGISVVRWMELTVSPT